MILVLAFSSFVLMGINDGVLGVLLPSLQTHYGIDKAVVGLLFMASVIGHIIAAFSSGAMAQKMGLRFLILQGGALISLCLVLVWQLPPFWLLLLILAIIGYAMAMLSTGLNAYIAPMPSSGRLLNYMHGFYGVGAFIGPLLATLILQLQLGWSIGYLFISFLCIALTLGLGIFFPVSMAVSAPHENSPMTRMLRIPALWFATIFLAFYVGVEVSVGNWSFTFLTEARSEHTVTAGWMVSGYWLGLTMGRMLLAFLVERMGKRLLVQYCMAGSIAGIILIWFSTGGVLSALGLWITGFCFGPLFPTTLSIVPEYMPQRLLTGAIGFISSIAYCGAALFPWMAGNLMQSAGLWTLFPFCFLTLSAMFIMWSKLSHSHTKLVEV
ncbi:MFS transporter [Candidatus Chlorohelix sp.]|uniref:MFS transporter n=1 Tax=Candidatus Chlorohelix sp. TaxID=3139201 RepID=UPI00307324B0